MNGGAGCAGLSRKEGGSRTGLDESEGVRAMMERGWSEDGDAARMQLPADLRPQLRVDAGMAVL